jgi:hypothetical protein
MTSPHSIPISFSEADVGDVIVADFKTPTPPPARWLHLTTQRDAADSRYAGFCTHVFCRLAL